jgi:ATP-dependent Clp protease ATP-binding subunit ClpC
MSIERFADSSMNIVHLAKRFTYEERGREVIDTDDLLVAILLEGKSAAARALKGLNLNIQSLRRGLELPELGADTVRPQSGPYWSNAPLNYTWAADLALFGTALAEADKQKSTLVLPEHILLAILADPSWSASRLLERLGVNSQAFRNSIASSLNSGKAGSPAPFPSSRSSNNPAASASTAKADGRGNIASIEQFGRNLTAEAIAGTLDPVIGREAVVENVLEILGRRSKNNPMLVGEPGVGKTAVIGAVAQLCASDAMPEKWRRKTFFLLDLVALTAGTKYRGEFEERFKMLLLVVKAENVILCIDEAHMMLGAGEAEGSTMDASSILKPALATGLSCIGSTTFDEFAKHIERDAALSRRFEQVVVSEPTVEETITILHGTKERYEAHHGIKFSDGALEAAARLSDRFISDGNLPDKAISVMDTTGSRMSRIVQAAKAKAPTDASQADFIVTEEHIASVIERKTGIPVTKLTQSEAHKLLHLEDELHERVVAQEEAIAAVANAVRRTRSGLSQRNAAFLFAGPTGVGKTELAKALAQALFGSDEQLITLDMSEYMERHTVSRLIGSPPGYVGSQDGGQLTEAVRRRPYSVVLFDEIEKAHPDVLNLLLQILEEGRLTDTKGRVASFKNTVVIMTTNAGASAITSKRASMGFEFAGNQSAAAKQEASYLEMKSKLLEALKQHFRPELLNRLTDLIAFHQLNQVQVRSIIDIFMKNLHSVLADKGLTVELTEAAKDHILKEGYSEEWGARPLRRAMEKLIENPLSVAVLSEKFSAGDTILVDSRDGEMVLTAKARE